jgi:tyrosyl-tRNA synthetase
VMIEYFTLVTDVPMAEVKEIEGELKDGKLHPMDVKKRLGREIVTIYHNAEAAREAQSEFERVFSEREIPTDIPEIEIPEDAIKDGKVWIVKLLSLAGFAPTNSEARRLIQQGAVTLDGERIGDPTAEIEVRDGQILKVGKLKFGKIARSTK